MCNTIKTFETRWTCVVAPKLTLLVLTLCFTIVSLHSLFRGPAAYNNFLIFANSFEHLAGNSNLYSPYPEQHNDIFKYSPTFALFMFPYYVLPRPVGLVFWNLTNVLIFWSGVQGLRLNDNQKFLVLAICFFPLLGATLNCQSNALVVGTMLLAFNAIESDRPLCSGFHICLGAFTKLFAVAMAPCFVLCGHRFRFVFALAIMTILMVLAPAPLIGFDSLLQQYRNWTHQLTTDKSGGMNFSIFTLLERTTGCVCPRLPLIAASATLLLAPLFRPVGCRTPAFRAMFLSSILIWVVIFNNKAESPTYVIATCGAAIWCVWQPATRLVAAFMGFFILLTGLALTDIVPSFIQDEIVMRFALKALPSTLLWIYIQWQLLTYPERVTSALPKSTRIAPPRFRLRAGKSKHGSNCINPLRKV
jgi:uncharacterized protein YqgC (DUF456 family)